jgi:hypothetical protein
LKVDDNLKIKKEPSKHSLHATVIPCRLAVMLAIQTMKDETVSQPDTKLKVIYDRALQGLTEKFLIGDINSRLIGNLLPYEQFRPTLTSIRGKTVPPQPKDLSSMNFEASEYSEYTRTLENELFLQYDNGLSKGRILIFMSQFGIEWLRESTRVHGDGTFYCSPLLFFQFYVLFGQNINFAMCVCMFTRQNNSNIHINDQCNKIDIKTFRAI